MFEELLLHLLCLIFHPLLVESYCPIGELIPTQKSCDNNMQLLCCGLHLLNTARSVNEFRKLYLRANDNSFFLVQSVKHMVNNVSALFDSFQGHIQFNMSAGCDCDNVELSVLCTNSSLINFPITLNPHITSLTIYNTEVSSISDGLQFYEVLHSLDLSHNKISTLQDRAFIFQVNRRFMTFLFTYFIL